MTGNNYQSKAMRTATLKCFDPANAALGLTGEAGEKRGVRLAELLSKGGAPYGTGAPSAGAPETNRCKNAAQNQCPLRFRSASQRPASLQADIFNPARGVRCRLFFLALSTRYCAGVDKAVHDVDKRKEAARCLTGSRRILCATISSA